MHIKSKSKFTAGAWLIFLGPWLHRQFLERYGDEASVGSGWLSRLGEDLLNFRPLARYVSRRPGCEPPREDPAAQDYISPGGILM